MRRKLDLWNDPVVRQVEAKNAWLRERLDTATEECRTLRDATEAAVQARDEARRDREAVLRDLAVTKGRLTEAEDIAKVWQSLAGAAQRVRHSSRGEHAALDHVLRHLLSVAHPDRWAGPGRNRVGA